MSHAIIKTQAHPPGALLSLMGACDLGVIRFQGGLLLSILVRPPLQAARRRIERLAPPRPVQAGLRKVKVETDRAAPVETPEPTAAGPRTGPEIEPVTSD